MGCKKDQNHKIDLMSVEKAKSIASKTYSKKVKRIIWIGQKEVNVKIELVFEVATVTSGYKRIL